MQTTYGPTPPAPPSVDPGSVVAAFADTVHAAWFWMPSPVHWLMVGWVIIWFARKAAGGILGTSTVEPHPREREVVDLPAHFDGEPGKRWWRCRYCGRGRVFAGTVEQEAREATDHEARCAHRHDTFAVATEPVSLVEPDVRVCTECGASVDPPVDDLLRGIIEDEEPAPTGWKPGLPLYGTPPPHHNDAQAQRFRQMISDAINRQQREK